MIRLKVYDRASIVTTIQVLGLIDSDALKGLGYVFVGVAQGDGTTVGASCWVLRLAECIKEPRYLLLVEGLVDLDGGVTGDAGSDSAAAGFGVFCLLVAVGNGEDLFEHAFEFGAIEAYGGGFDGEGAGTEGFGFEAVALEFFGNLSKGDHLSGEEINEQGHEEALALDLFGVTLA